MTEGLALSEASLRCTIEWAGDEYPCVGGPEYGKRLLGEGGFEIKANVKIKVRTEVFPSGVGFPQEKQSIIYKPTPNSTPRTYKIDSITNWWDTVLELVCVDPRMGTGGR